MVDILTFGGLRSHSMYWDKAQEPQMNCFDAFAANVFTKDRLSPQAEPSSSD